MCDMHACIHTHIMGHPSANTRQWFQHPCKYTHTYTYTHTTTYTHHGAPPQRHTRHWSQHPCKYTYTYTHTYTHSISWGTPSATTSSTPTSMYTPSAADIDRFMYENQDFLAVVAAGNGGSAVSYTQIHTYIRTICACMHELHVLKPTLPCRGRCGKQRQCCELSSFMYVCIYIYGIAVSYT